LVFSLETKQASCLNLKKSSHPRRWLTSILQFSFELALFLSGGGEQHFGEGSIDEAVCTWASFLRQKSYPGLKRADKIVVG